MQKKTTVHWSTGQTWTVPHSTSATFRTMATTTCIQKGTPCIQPGKQRLRPPVHRASNKMDARGLRIPRQIHMDTHHQSGELHWMANAYRMKHQQVLPETDETLKGHMNQSRKNARSTKKSSTVWNCGVSRDERKENTGRIHQNIRRLWNNVYRPNRAIPHKTKMWQQIHNDHGENR